MKKLMLIVAFAFTVSGTGELYAAEEKGKTKPITARGAFAAFFVPDLEASVTWYTEKLGLKVVSRPPASDVAKVAILEGGNLIIELIEHKGAPPLRTFLPEDKKDSFVQGVFKAGIIVDDFDATVAMLKERGVEIAFGPFPAKKDQRANVLIRDNAGNMIQFFGK